MTSLKDHKIVTKEEWIESRKDLQKGKRVYKFVGSTEPTKTRSSMGRS